MKSKSEGQRKLFHEKGNRKKRKLTNKKKNVKKIQFQNKQINEDEINIEIEIRTKIEQKLIQK